MSSVILIFVLLPFLEKKPIWKSSLHKLIKVGSIHTRHLQCNEMMTTVHEQKHCFIHGTLGVQNNIFHHHPGLLKVVAEMIRTYNFPIVLTR